MEIILRALLEIKSVEEKYRKILEDPALFTSENGGFSAHEHEILEKLISLCGEANIAADVIIKKSLKKYENVC